MDFRLFISHSSPNPESVARLRALKDEIERITRSETPIRVLIDVDQIVASDDWQQRIAFMLHRCHGGVVLVDEAALSSDWVLAEAAFLSLRHRADSGFPFVPVSFLDEPDLTKARQARAEQRDSLSKTAWRVVGFSDVQCVRGQAPGDIADRLVSALRAKGLLVPGVSPADRSQSGRVSGLLRSCCVRCWSAGQAGSSPGGIHVLPVNRARRASSLSMLHLVAVDR
jgi:hypothetical protein